MSTAARTPSTPSTTQRNAPSELQGVWLVAEREIGSKLRSKAFIISTAILFAIALAGILFAGLASKDATGTSVAVVGTASASVEGIEGISPTQVADRAAAESLVRSGDVDAAIVNDPDSPAGFTVIADSQAPTTLLLTLAKVPTVELLNPPTTDEGLRYLVAIGFGVVFLMAASLFGSTIAQSVVEEKQTRIVEILLATVSARTILAGKILGNSILALGQVIAIAALTSVGMLATGQDLLLGELGTALIWFAILFAFGFVLLASLYAALASLVSRQEDVTSAVSPVMWLVMIPYIAIIMFNTNVKVLAIMSYIPFSAPVGMPMRLYLGTAEWWEPVVSLGILVVAIAIVWWLGARIYERSILRTGAKVKLKDALAAKE